MAPGCSLFKGQPWSAFWACLPPGNPLSVFPYRMTIAVFGSFHLPIRFCKVHGMSKAIRSPRPSPTCPILVEVHAGEFFKNGSGRKGLIEESR